MCDNDIYMDDLAVIRVQRLSATDKEFGMWQVHRFGNLFLQGWQDGVRKGGRSLLPVEAGKLGSGSFLQVIACKSGGRSLLPIEAGKLKSI